ncbi:MAG: 16S rRNA (cytidine(1402)-2'-O)-methyltransferase [Clostridia bacterium]|nr:16S rRNA (cytidine(1402)-2'-O)-methyltransferase [Clostridia bacterium]MEE1184533.1 16S rRNA (cytidine(1402)-2'-O)-methyltransferase [Acutalibacteraceae bacterium]
MAGKLFVIGTPIGNLGDFSPRGIEALENSDFIAAEDTRVTVKLLNHFGIKKEMISYYEHNKLNRGEQIISRILAGENCALVSDAGMPAISDPGEELVDSAHNAGITVESVPGPSAVTTALALSGMPSGRFCFEGFLSVNKAGRKQHLQEIKEETRTMIFYEAPHKLLATLKDMQEILGDRKIAIVRELTKIHESVFRTTLSDAVKFYSENTPRGEFVLILSGKDKEREEKLSLEQAISLAKTLMKNGESASVAAKQAALAAGVKKSEIYKAIIDEKI